MNKRLRLLASAIVFMLLLTPAVCLISTEEAEQTALKYEGPNEYTAVYGPYTYLNHSCYLADYTPVDNDSQTNDVIVIDAESGKVIENKEIAEKIILTHFIVVGVRSPKLITDLEEESALYKKLEGIMEENVKTTKDSITVMNNTTKLDDSLSATEMMKESYHDLSDNRDKMLEVVKKINAGDASYENADRVVALNKEFVTLAEAFLENMKVYREQINVYYDFGNTMGYNSDRYSWENARERELAYADSLAEYMTEEHDDDKAYIEDADGYTEYMIGVYDQKIEKYGDKETPGFGILFAVAAVLTGSVFMKRKK